MADDLNFDGIDLSGGSAGNFDLSNFDGIDLGGGSAGNFDLSSLLADLSNIGTDLGPTSNMGMDKDLLAQLGLLDLVGGNTGNTGNASNGIATRSLSKIPTNGIASVLDTLTPSQRDALNLPSSDSGATDNTQAIIDALAKDSTDRLPFSEGIGINPAKAFDKFNNLDMMNGGTGLKNDTMPNQTSMNGGQGATLDMPGGTMTASGFVPTGSQVALGNPNSPINNPNNTGVKAITSANNVATNTGAGPGAAANVTTTPGETKVTPGTTIGNTNNPLKTLLDKVTGGANPAGTKSGMDPMTMMLLMYLMSQMGKSGGSSGTQASIPQLQANQRMLPYTAPSRPGAGGQTYFSPQTYTPKASGGMIGYADGGGISTLGGYSDGGRLLRGPGDGVSDNIPATIAGKQPARLADGEFVVPARIVSELGNGSTDAGAKRLYEMMDRVQKARRKTKNVAADTKAAKYLPA